MDNLKCKFQYRYGKYFGYCATIVCLELCEFVSEYDLCNISSEYYIYLSTLVLDISDSFLYQIKYNTCLTTLIKCSQSLSV